MYSSWNLSFNPKVKGLIMIPNQKIDENIKIKSGNFIKLITLRNNFLKEKWIEWQPQPSYTGERK